MVNLKGRTKESNWGGGGQSVWVFRRCTMFFLEPVVGFNNSSDVFGHQTHTNDHNIPDSRISAAKVRLPLTSSDATC